MNSAPHENRSAPRLGKRVLAGQCRRKRLARAARTIQATYSQPTKVAELAAGASMSLCHFVRAFHTEYGIPPAEYMIRIRLRVAINLLAAKERYPAEKVAQQVGYLSRETLHRQLRKRTDLSIKQIRQAVQGDADNFANRYPMLRV